MFTELDYRILEFVLQSSDPVPSHQLAMACDVSVNTVRTEIDLLNQELDTHGICIRMKRSSGVSMEILDPTAARPWLHQMRDAVIRNKRLRRKYSERVYSMARIICVQKTGSRSNAWSRSFMCRGERFWRISRMSGHCCKCSGWSCSTAVEGMDLQCRGANG